MERAAPDEARHEIHGVGLPRCDAAGRCLRLATSRSRPRRPGRQRDSEHHTQLRPGGNAASTQGDTGAPGPKGDAGRRGQQARDRCGAVVCSAILPCARLLDDGDSGPPGRALRIAGHQDIDATTIVYQCKPRVANCDGYTFRIVYQTKRFDDNKAQGIISAYNN